MRTGPKPSHTKKRRVARRIKAAASIALAVAAGTFLACQRGAEAVKNALDSGDGAPEKQPDAGADVEVVTAVAEERPEAGPRIKDASVDVKEHRKGMPVRDNLLE